MTLPTLTTLDGTTSAAEVLGNDEVLANTFGAFDITHNVTEILSPMIIGPVRRHFSGSAALAGEFVLLWKAPSSDSQGHQVILRELCVSVLPSSGTYSQDIDDNDKIELKADLHTADTGFPGTTNLGTLTLNSEDTFTLDLGNTSLAEGRWVRVYTNGITNTPWFHASISILAYMRHRTD